MFQASFKKVFKGGSKHINSFSKKVCFVVVVCQSSQLPEQKEGLFQYLSGKDFESMRDCENIPDKNTKKTSWIFLLNMKKNLRSCRGNKQNFCMFARRNIA